MVFLFGAIVAVVLELGCFVLMDDVDVLMWTHGGCFGCVIMLWTGREVLVVIIVVVVVLLVVLQTG